MPFSQSAFRIVAAAPDFSSNSFLVTSRECVGIRIFDKSIYIMSKSSCFRARDSSSKIRRRFSSFLLSSVNLTNASVFGRNFSVSSSVTSTAPLSISLFRMGNTSRISVSFANSFTAIGFPSESASRICCSFSGNTLSASKSGLMQTCVSLSSFSPAGTAA